MKPLMLILNLLFCSASWSYYEDNSEVQRLVRAGRYEVDYRGCEDQSADALIVENEKLCLNILPLPSMVEAEVGHMRSNELENESDYDQRITSLLHFSVSDLKKQRIDLEDVLGVFSFLNVNAMADELSLASEVVDTQSFPEFDELFIDLFYKAGSNSQQFIRDSFRGELVQIIKYEEGVELYPGGGFFVSHYLIIAANHAMYIKFSWWNS